MTTSIDPSQLPLGRPPPVDDGAAVHVQGSLVPDVHLRSTNGSLVSLARLGKGRAVVYAYPRTGRPGEPELTDDWDLIPGARGEELVARLHLPFPVLSDADLALTQAMRLPTFRAAGQTLLHRLTLMIRDGRVEPVWYPVFPPDRHAG